jgi:TatD DNase family protein
MHIRAIDSHCHPQFPQYDPDRATVIQRALDAGVGMICVGTDLGTSEKAVKLAEEHPGMWASIGLHPADASGESYDENAYERLIMNSKVVAVGEIGLDFRGRTVRNVQETVFRRQLEHVGTRLPCIIHCRDAHERMIAILKEYPARGVIHSFNGTIEQALSYIYAGWYIGLNAIVSFSPLYEEMVRRLPENRILLETDSPYLAPEPFRGKRNEPLNVLRVADHVARIRGLGAEIILRMTLSNTLGCFSSIMISE